MSKKTHSCILAVLVCLLLSQGCISDIASLARLRPAPEQEGFEPFYLRVSFGYTDLESTAWDGLVNVRGGRVTGLQGWQFMNNDRVIGTNTWFLKTTKAVPPLDTVGDVIRTPETEAVLARPMELKGVEVEGSARPEAVVEVRTLRGNFSTKMSELAMGVPVERLGGAARIERLPVPTLLTDDHAEDDFPSIAAGADGSVWAVWVAYTGVGDEIRVRKYLDGKWGTFTRVPGAGRDVWMPKAAVDGQGRLWVVWSEQVDGNWDLYARAMEGDRWLRKQRVTEDPGPDINAAVVSDETGKLWLTWQGFRDDSFDILLSEFDGQRWSKEVRVTDSSANDWFPAVAVEKNGRAHIAWDTYRNGNYDVYMRSYLGGRFSEETAITNSPKYEAHASVAVDPADRVWVAWEEGPVNWAKDYGYTIRKNPPGTQVHDKRSLGIRCYVGGVAKEPVANPAESLPQGERQNCERPGLTIDGSGRLWLTFRRQFERYVEPPADSPSKRTRPQGWWGEYVTSLDGDHWTPAVSIPNSWGRLTVFPSSVVAADGTLWLAWPTDRRQYASIMEPQFHDVYVAPLKPGAPVSNPVLRDPALQESVVVPQGHKNEAEDIKAVRNYQVIIDGVPQKLLRGDLHRHTELSWDLGGRNDGSVIEFYRYMIDAAGMDFGALTDHNAGGDLAYWWWYTEKTTDLFLLKNTFAPLFGYERSCTYPNGHRNVFHAVRGIPVVSFFTKGTMSGSRPGVGADSNFLLDNDTKLLYESIRQTDGIAISHSSGTRMGTDWRDNDPELEPVVEIFQGCRNSYEHEGAPKAADPNNPTERPGGYEPAGFVWRAWEKGYRLGTIASSDHESTHISYAFVFTPERTRQAILDAIRKRHTYGATDNIIVDYKIGEHFMGDEFYTTQAPKLSVRIKGTAPVARVDVIKNNTFVYQATPSQAEVQFEFTDQEATPGTSYYYVRVQQTDGQMAWSSPIWVNRRT